MAAMEPLKIRQVTAASSDWWVVWGPSASDPQGRARVLGWGFADGDDTSTVALLPSPGTLDPVRVADVVAAGWMTLRHFGDLTPEEQEAPVQPYGIV